MDVKEAERVVIAKPVPSRPICSTFGTFSELLAGAINAAPPSVCPETTVVPIRPKTVRFKPMANPVPSNQAEPSRTAICNSSAKASKSDSTTSTVVYKPLAKLVSKATFSLLANMGNFNYTSRQQMQQSVEGHVQHPSQDKGIFRSQANSNLNLIMPPHNEADQTIESSKIASHKLEEDPKALSAIAGDRPSYDGYNWRKYGQKVVKGSEYPRSYYKCTHPNCPVKKKVERSFDGQIAEIVYKGEHNHPKPQPPKRSSSGTQGLGLVSDGTGQDANNPVWNSNLNERNEGAEGRVENQNEVGLLAHSTYQGKAPLPYEPIVTPANNAGAGTSDNSCGLSVECDEGKKGLEGEEAEPRNKKRKSENQSNEAGISEEGLQEPRIVVQSSIDSEILSDGFRWRKYGQKVVKGNSYPRSYYRCTNLKCNVRKHVERALDDPRAFITTYEGKHNHDMPLKNTNPVASESDTPAPTSKEKP
ncbi:WRKY transcription factor 44-like [Mangifera indica]|uniref:WRKY transcription factor 44-like n=1 Tax=Mangifera indica TaxID=29780 RepID=UPI001CFBBEE8|nr:WRKY transcription factor 44-like [Mangifera indica]XP_044472827.1 WRKY transcription factor 44-like [Mangifera indica]